MGDIQTLFDSFSKGMRNARKDYHLTLGKLIKKLQKLDKNKLVKFSSGESVGVEDSYRGYYSDLCFAIFDNPKTVKEFLEQCKSILGNTYTGYKGGDFVMDEDTPLWKAEYGSCGDAIIDIIDDKEIILVCKNID